MSAEPTIVTYLDMRTRPEPTSFPADESPASDLVVTEARRPNPDLTRALYSMVGQSYQWTDRLSWTSEQWRETVTAPGYRTWLGYAEGSPIGYVELDGREDPDVEIAYFGLLPAFVGQGLGGPFLRAAIDAAWSAASTERVWLHTCTDDHPRALPNYLAAGFTVYDERAE